MKNIIKKIVFKLPLSWKMAIWKTMQRLSYRDRNIIFYFLNDNQYDKELVAVMIRMNANVLHKVICTEWSPDREKSCQSMLEKCLNIWNKNGWDKSEDIVWAEKVLANFKEWDTTHKTFFIPVTDKKFDKFEDIIRTRRSVRYFLDIDLPQELIEKVIDAGRWAPCSCNRQNWKIVVKKREKISGDKSRITRAAPVNIYVAIDGRGYVEKYAAAMDSAAMVENMLLMIHYLGLGACWVYQADSVNQKTMREKLGLSEYEYLYSLIMLGYPAEEPDVPVKKPLTNNVRYIG